MELGYLKFNEQENKYFAESVDLDQKEDSFLLSDIKKTDNGYNVEIIEYLEDYSSSPNIVIRNTNDEEIQIIDITKENNVSDIVRNNVDKFNKKIITLRLENDKLYVEKVADVAKE